MAGQFDDLESFLVVAEELNFTRAAARLNISASALSQAIRRLEARLGLRLLVRSTRSVAMTPAGERMFTAVSDGLGTIRREIDALGSQSEVAEGLLRITTSEYAALVVLEPAMRDFLAAHSGISVEAVIDNGLVDIVAGKFDAGIRVGESVEQDMISFRVRDAMPVRIVGAPAYFGRHARPEHPADLARHTCINMRFSGSGELFAWEFEEGERDFRVRVPSQLIVSDAQVALNATLAGTGLSYMPLDLVSAHLASGDLVSVLDKWVPPLPELHLYYPDRTHQMRAFTLFIQHMRNWAKAHGRTERREV
jgi:DNA-binding transcriptional LysR family regulator|tara:strand:- start:51692 stop:52615 length:924 start_codon:yes stop_codon:yes gene_type:complete